MVDETPREGESSDETLLGDADEVEHPSIEEQVDDKLEQEKEAAEDG
jgi:hypothetical protein